MKSRDAAQADNDVLYDTIAGDPQYRAELFRVLRGDVDIEGQFLGFVSTYRHLAEMIPARCIVVDLGCAYAVQSYYFRHHRSYIGVDLGELRFQTANALHYVGQIADFVEMAARRGNLTQCFAICNYVPPWHADNGRLARETFSNVYVYYPEASHSPALELKPRVPTLGRSPCEA